MFAGERERENETKANPRKERTKTEAAQEQFNGSISSIFCYVYRMISSYNFCLF